MIPRTALLRVVPLALFVLAGAACSGPEDAPPPQPAAAPEPAIAAPDFATGAPSGLNQVAGLAVDGEMVWLATSGGIVILNARSRHATILAGDERVSHAHATDVALAPGGVAWTSHGLSPTRTSELAASQPDDAAPAPVPAPGEPQAPPTAQLQAGPREGGVRSFGRGATMSAYFAEDGLGSDDVDSIAVSRDIVAAAAGPAVALLRLDAPAPRFETRLTENPRRLQVLDLAAGTPSRRLVEFRPRGERMTAVAIDAGALLVGSTDAIYRLEGDDLWRIAPACRVRGGMPSHVFALAALPGGFVASLGIPAAPGETAEPAGLAELRRGATEGARIARCHAPGIDVPAALTLDVAVDRNVLWLATYEGVVRIEGDDPELLARGVEIPSAAPTAIAGDGRGGVWVGTWGGGAWHLSEGLIDSFTIQPDGTTRVETMRGPSPS